MKRKTNGPGKKKKPTGTIQVPASKGASRVVSKGSAAGQRVAKAKQSLEIRKRGGRLLQSEKNAIRKSFNPTKVRKSMPKTKKK
jgi:hypothetical protein